MLVGRTLLFVPGDRPDRIRRALASDADAVAVDLEDAVAPAAEAVARASAVDAVRAAEPRPNLFLRVGAMGGPEFAADLATARELLHARSQVVLATAAAGLPGPVDGPHPALDDTDGLVRASRRSRELGFTGKVVLHPRQIGPVRDAFAPTEAELAHAREVLDADAGTGAFRLADGTFVDAPVVRRAAALLGVTR